MAQIQSIADVLASDKHSPRNRKSYGVSGWSDELPDATAFHNVPIHPQEAKPMHPIWAKRNEIQLKESQGFRVIPLECFRPGFRGADGQNPIWCDSPTAKPDETLGAMTRYGGQRIAMWCTPATAAERQKTIDERNLRARIGNMVDSGSINNGRSSLGRGAMSVSVSQIDKTGMGDSRSPFEMPEELLEA